MEIRILPMRTDAEMQGKGYVHYRAWQEAYADIIPPEVMARHSLEKCVNNARRSSTNTFIAKDGGQVVGFVCYGAYRDDTLTHTGEIYALYVLRAYHGMRVGYRLMQAAMTQLEEYPQVALWVLRDNLPAQRFYTRYGFCFDGAEAKIPAGTEKRMLYKR